MITLIATVFSWYLSAPALAVSAKSVERADEFQASKNRQETEAKREVRKLVVGISEISQYPFFSLVKKTDRGFAWSVLEHFAKLNNIEFEYKVLPLHRLQLSLEQGHIDFIFPDNPYWNMFKDKELPNIYSGPVVMSIATSFTSVSKQHYTIDMVNRVAIPFGYSASQWHSGIKQYGIQTIPVTDLLQGLYSVHTGNADAVDIEYNIAIHLITNMPYWRELSVARSLPHMPVSFHLSSIKHIDVLTAITNYTVEHADHIALLKNKYNIKYHHEIFRQSTASKLEKSTQR